MRYQALQCTCNAPECDNWIITDGFFDGPPVPMCYNLSKPQAERVAEVLNELSYTNNPDGNNINEIQ